MGCIGRMNSILSIYSEVMSMLSEFNRALNKEQHMVRKCICQVQ